VAATVWDCKYHLVLVTKYRYPVLVAMLGVRCRDCCARPRGRMRWSYTPITLVSVSTGSNNVATTREATTLVTANPRAHRCDVIRSKENQTTRDGYYDGELEAIERILSPTLMAASVFYRLKEPCNFWGIVR
jgi:hypothetical protein